MQIMIRVHVHSDYEQLSQHAAAWLVQRLRDSPEATVCVAAGSTPIRTYELLADVGRRDPLLFASRTVLKLDEWGGLPTGGAGTCEYQLRSLLIDPLGLADRYISFNSRAANPTAECDRIKAWLTENGPLGICVLGLGVNGHLGFNEPAASLAPSVHVAGLSAESLSHAMIRGCGVRPAYGLTLGIADILQSREVVLLASGPTKRQPLQQLMKQRIDTHFPASMLHIHADVTMFCDEEAWPTSE